MDLKKIAANTVGIIFLIAIAGGVFYAFSHHIIFVNSCKSGQLFIYNGTSPYCVSASADTVLAGGKIAPFSLNSSVAAYNGQIIPLDFSFLDGKPLLTVWNQKSYQGIGGYEFLTIPDTFKVHMQYSSSTPTEFIIMTDSEYAQWANSGFSSPSYVEEQTGNNISTWFNQSTGCAGYVAVIKSINGGAFTIYPNETVLYDPASSPTGVCAS
ncbi:hypothetical protein M1293_02050 [Candidatus Parvarchaeota archaeon]|nr:hypothetical protein [Candidatus Parvarchaeota archaeon]